MCGIAGLYNLSGGSVDERVVERMCELLRHRGPDDSGLWHCGPIALGHRRLRIIDLTPRGRNPMPNEDGTIQLVFNGEIYNYLDLRRDLLKKGHRFTSDTDTEVIVHLFEELGPECVHELNGIFAFALWDRSKQQLFLARDRCGVKPLYYMRIGSSFAFASEIKAFLAVPGFSVAADVFALADLLTFQNTFGDRTLFEGVKLVPGGHYLRVRNGEITTRQYWDLSFQPDIGPGLEYWAGTLRDRFEAAVNRQLVSDVPVGTYLSGGMDTGSISAVAVRMIQRMHTFTCGFEIPSQATELEQFFDERIESYRLAELLGTIHHEVCLGPEHMPRVLPQVVWHLDEPRVGISYQVFYTAELIRRHVTVVLSGVGGDELFAGYPWRYEPIVDLNDRAFNERYYRLWLRFFSDEEKRAILTPDVHRKLGDYCTFDSFREVLRGADGADPLHRALYFDFKTFLNGLLLVDDKLSMAHSVESRVPFLDNEVLDLVARIPSQFKLGAGKSKIVLKQAMSGLLPHETIHRRKQGFTPPDQTWYKTCHLPYIKDLILGPRALERGYVEPSALFRILDDHITGRRNHRFLIWSLMCFEWWNRVFVDREDIPPPLPIPTQG